MPMTQWIPKLEPMEPLHKKLSTSVSHLPIPERKPLQGELKYAFLGEGETYPVVISSSLTTQQEVQLIEALRAHKKA